MTTPQDRDFESWIQKWYAFSASARERLEKIHHCEIEPIDFQEAYRERNEFKRATDMLYLELPSVDEAVKQLSDYNFAALYPELLQEIHVEEPMVPEEFPRLLTEKTVKLKGEIWRIHKYDADPFPSSPHAHNLETGLKLHLGTGELFRKTKQVGRIKCKELDVLREQIKTEFGLPEYECH